MTKRARPTPEEWFDDALPDEWFEGGAVVTVDREEILVVGDLGAPSAGLSDLEQIGAFRESTREERMALADRAQATYGRKVSWGARCGDTEARFTTVSVPAMTRLRIDERRLLDTLIAGGVAKSRSDALSWCVRLVAEKEAEWLSELREATDAIKDVRDKGPDRS